MATPERSWPHGWANRPPRTPPRLEHDPDVVGRYANDDELAARRVERPAGDVEHQGAEPTDPAPDSPPPGPAPAPRSQRGRGRERVRVAAGRRKALPQKRLGPAARPPTERVGALTVSDASGFVLALVAWSWVGLPFLKDGADGVRNVWRAKFLNKAPDGSELL